MMSILYCEINTWVDDAKKGMENLLTKPLEVKEQCKRQIKDLQEAYGEAMLELLCQKRAQHLRKYCCRDDYCWLLILLN